MVDEPDVFLSAFLLALEHGPQLCVKRTSAPFDANRQPFRSREYSKSVPPNRVKIDDAGYELVCFEPESRVCEYRGTVVGQDARRKKLQQGCTVHKEATKELGN